MLELLLVEPAASEKRVGGAAQVFTGCWLFFRWRRWLLLFAGRRSCCPVVVVAVAAQSWLLFAPTGAAASDRGLLELLAAVLAGQICSLVASRGCWSDERK